MTLDRMIAAKYQPRSALGPPMMPVRTVSLALAAGLALGLLAFLVHMVQGRPIDPALHGLRLEQLSSAAQLEAMLDQEFELARLSLDSESAALSDLRPRLALARHGLQGSFAAPELGPGVATALQAYLSAAQDQDQLRAQLEGRLHDFTERFRQVQQLGDTVLITSQSASATGVRRAVMTLLGAATNYSIQAVPANTDELEHLLAEVGSRIPAIPDAHQRDTLLQLLDEVRALRTSKDKLQDELNRFHSIPTAATLKQLRGAYLDHTRAEEIRRERGQLILAVYAGALFVAFGVLALRLRYSFAELDRANAELQRANESLEQRITERTAELHKALEDLRLQQAHLIQSEKMASLGQLVAGVAHEINTPLGYARSNVQTIREGLAGMNSSDPTVQEQLSEADLLLGDAEHGLEKISELVLTLKDFSRVDRSQTELFSVNDGLEAALKICHNQLKDRIEVQRHYGEVPRILSSPSQLNQVFLNLINNAAQAIDGTGTLTIATLDRGDLVEIRVRDSGCGMPADIQAHIFEPFFTTKPVGKGTGLGLSIAFRIIENHQGKIQVHSAPGEGAEFIIALPARRQQATAERAVEAGEPS